MKTKPLIRWKAAVGLLLLSLSATTMFAQGTAFTYQGGLNDGVSPANGSYDLTFSLWNAASGPAQVGGTLTNSAVGVSNGLFTVSLDFGANFPGADRWLEINVRTNGPGAFTTLSPRQQITPAPYAIRAANYSGTVSASQLTGTISSNNIAAGSITTVMLGAGAVGSNQLADGAVTTSALADGAVTSPKLSATTNWFALTITKPSPADNDNFGSSLAAVGTDRVLIGAPNDSTGASAAGAAYLFSANGALLTTFVNPTPEIDEYFGTSVAAVGSDQVLIGAPSQSNPGAFYSGSAYLFTADGALLTTFTNPTPTFNGHFGSSMAALGTYRAAIGAPGSGVGSAYLFSTNGTLLTTFLNPITPALNDAFGYSLAGVGADRMLIGTPGDNTGATDAGSAYLFNTNGTFLLTFTNPTPAVSDFFGVSVAALGSDRVLIGAPFDDTGATDAGTAYLFATNGTLLTAFTNPTPASGDFFGLSVAAVGTDRVLIGAYHDDTGANDVGAAYLFSTNGTLLLTFTNPTPAANEEFAYAVAGLGTDRMVVGARYDSTVEDHSGAAYVFALESYSSGIIADSVRARSITSAQLADSAVTAAKLADGAVTAAKLDSTIGLWTTSGSGMYSASGYVAVGTTSPQEVSLLIAGQDAVQLRLQNSLNNNSYWNIYSESSSNLAFVSGVGGYAYVRATDGAYFNASDARLKRDVAPLDGILDRVLKLRPVTYRLRAESESAPQTFGLIAQEVEKLFPEVVGDCNGMKALSYSELVPVTIRAIQELNQKLTDELKQKGTEITELKLRLEKLERLMNEKNGGAK